MPTDAQAIAPKPARRWLRWLRPKFGLRSLLGLVTLAGIGLGLWVNSAERQRRAVAELRNMGASVEYEDGYDKVYSQPPKRAWYPDLLGDDYFSSVLAVYVWKKELWKKETVESGFLHLKELIRLKSLNLAETQVSDAGLANLKGFTWLERLDLSGTQVTDAGLVHLKGLTRLAYLHLGGTRVTDAGLAHLKGLTQLELLGLSGTQVTDAGLVHLKGLTQLEWLYLDSTRVTDAGLEHLKGLTRLDVLDLDNTQVTGAGIAELQKALPECDIDGP